MPGFADTIDAACDAFLETCDLVPRFAADILSERLIDRSPVGNPAVWRSKPRRDYVAGGFRSNWNLGVDTIDTTLTKATNIFTVNGLEKVEGFGHRYFFSNASPQAWRIEVDGWSPTQARAGVVRVTAAEGAEILALAINMAISHQAGRAER